MTSTAARGLAAAALVAAALAAPSPAARAEGSAPSPGAPGSEAAAAVGPVTNMPLPRFVSMRAETANARRGPSLEHRVDWTFLRRGLPLEVTAEHGNWRRVRDAEGAGGWVHHTLLSGVRTALIQADGPTPLRSGAGEGTAIRAFAEPGVVARLEACDGGWCRLSAGGVSGWVPRAALWGVRADETLDR
jgi:SH3-like domain-containing protein